MRRDRRATRFFVASSSIVLASAFVALMPRASAERAQNPRAPLSGGARVTHEVYDPSDPSSCASCHEATSTGAPGPLIDETNGLCLTCHDDPSAAVGEGARAHHGGQLACVECHNAHDASEKSLLLAPPAALCTRCHDDVSRAMKGPVAHGALSGPGSCLTCHAPHASTRSALLSDDANTLCLACHQSDAIRDHDGKSLANIKAIVDGAKHLHMPIETEGCIGCHAPHGGTHFRLLREPFPSTFYAPYTRESVALCFTCHEESLVEARVTTTATGFRDGERNLHAVHAERGRTCRACHDVHGSNVAHQLRESVAYGSHGWRLPLNFSESEHGGSCAKTCHVVKQYDRRLRPDR